MALLSREGMILRVFKAKFCYNKLYRRRTTRRFLRKKVAQMTNTKGTNAGTTGTATPAKAGATPAKQEICHPSVCVGNAKPAHCVCPTNK
jgi:hypothetical protein